MSSACGPVEREPQENEIDGENINLINDFGDEIEKKSN
jgi:hypothetical protein